MDLNLADDHSALRATRKINHRKVEQDQKNHLGQATSSGLPVIVMLFPSFTRELFPKRT